MRREFSDMGSPFFTLEMPGGVTKFHFGADSLTKDKWWVWRSDGGRVGWPTVSHFPSKSEARKDVARRVRFLREVLRLEKQAKQSHTGAANARA